MKPLKIWTSQRLINECKYPAFNWGDGQDKGRKGEGGNEIHSNMLQQDGTGLRTEAELHTGQGKGIGVEIRAGAGLICVIPAEEVGLPCGRPFLALILVPYWPHNKKCWKQLCWVRVI